MLGLVNVRLSHYWKTNLRLDNRNLKLVLGKVKLGLVIVDR